MPVLCLVALGQTVLVRRFNADEDRGETRLCHQVHELFIVSQIDRNLRIERHASYPLAPFDQGRQQVFLEMPLIPHEVIVNEKDALTPSELVQPIQLANDLPGGFDARPVSKKYGNVAKLAIEGAAARILDRHGRVVLQVSQFPQRCRGLSDIGKFRRSVDAFCPALFEVPQERRERHLGFVQHKMVYILELRVLSSE